jgi:hypothetical protein
MIKLSQLLNNLQNKAKYWENRYRKAEQAFHVWKRMTKEDLPASLWTPEYRRLAESIHSLGRDVFYVETEE